MRIWAILGEKHFRPASAVESHKRPTRRRKCRFERLEDRRMLSGQQDVWIQRQALLDGEINGGQGYSQSSDSATLAWSESYELSSYVTMYRATGKTSYLDKLVTHVDRILGSAADDNHDGYLGWGSYQYSVNLAGNAGFETAATNATLPTSWTRLRSTASTAFLDTTQPHAGSSCVTLKTDPANGPQWLQTSTFNGLVLDNKAYEPNKLYCLSFYGKTNGSPAGGRAEVDDVTTGTVLASVSFSGSAWQQYSTTFSMPSASGHDVRIRLTHADATISGGAVSFDDVSLQQRAEFLVQDAMIAAPIAEFVASVKSSPVLRAAYGNTAARYDAFIRDNILAKWEPDYRAVNSTSGTYVLPDDGSSTIPRNSVPYNQFLTLGDTFLWLYAADGKAADAARAVKLGNTFKSKLTLQHGKSAYMWQYSDRVLPTDYFNSSSREDASHANLDIRFVIDANQMGLVFNSTDISRFASTLTDVMWNQSYTNPTISHYVDGSGDTSFTQYLSWWAGLAGYSAPKPTWLIIESVYAHNGLWSTASTTPAMQTVAELVATFPQGGLLQNGSFEAAAAKDSSLPGGWTRVQSYSWNVSRDAAHRASGKSGLVLSTPRGNAWQGLEQRLSWYVPGVSTTLIFSGLAGSPQAVGCVEIYDVTASKSLLKVSFSNTTWQQYTKTFTTPSVAGHDVEVRLYSNSTSYATSARTVYLDDVTLRQ
jgi:hypothetical protein